MPRQTQSKGKDPPGVNLTGLSHRASAAKLLSLTTFACPNL